MADVRVFGGDSILSTLFRGRQSQVTPCLTTARKVSDLLLSQLQEQLLSVLVFGSVGRNEASERSDLDMLVVVKELSGTTMGSINDILLAFEDRLVVQVADPRILFANLLTMEPFTITCFSEAVVLYDRWNAQDLIRAVRENSMTGDRHSAQLLMNRAAVRLELAHSARRHALSHAQAAVADAGFALCHIRGAAPQSLGEMLECLGRIQAPEALARWLQLSNDKAPTKALADILSEAKALVELAVSHMTLSQQASLGGARELCNEQLEMS